MSILIKDMKMPKGELGAVPIIIFSDGAVVHYMTAELLGEAIPVPPHGDLIDRKDLLADTTDMIHSTMVFGGARVYTSDAIKNAPTIIPAEEGET